MINCWSHLIRGAQSDLMLTNYNIDIIEMVGNFIYNSLFLRPSQRCSQGGRPSRPTLATALIPTALRIYPLLPFQVFIEANGVNALTYCLLDTSLPRVSEAIIACLLRLHNNPTLRCSQNYFRTCSV